jgi:hypothetical protein
MDNPKINIILASNPSFSPLTAGTIQMLEAQADFEIVARPTRGQELFDAMGAGIAQVLIVVAGLYAFARIAQVAARSGIPMAVIISHAHKPAEDQVEFLRSEMKEFGALGEIFNEADMPDVIDHIRKVARERHG